MNSASDPKSVFEKGLLNQLIDKFKESILKSSIDEKYHKSLYYVFKDFVVLSLKNVDDITFDGCVFKSLTVSDTVFEIKELEHKIQIKIKNTSTNKSQNMCFSKELLQDLQAFHLMNAEELA